MTHSAKLVFSATLALVLVSPDWVRAAGQALPIMATTTSGQRNPGFLVGAEADGLVIATAPQGGNSIKILYSTLQEVNVEEPKGWSLAVNQLQAGNYADAEKAFAQFADDYAHLIPWKDGFGSVARLYHFRALKGLGKHRELAAAMDRQLAKPLILGDLNRVDFDDLRGWALLGKGDLLALQSYLREFQETAATPLAIQPAFKPGLPARLVASLHFLRGHLHDQQQRPELALIDYQSAMTRNYGSDHSVFEPACLHSLRIAATLSQAKPGDAVLKKTAHSLALTYRDCAGRGKLPAEYQALLESTP